MAPAADEEETRSALPAEEPPLAQTQGKSAALRWSDRPAAELERLLEEQPAHPDREAVAAALAAKWKEHYLRVSRAPAEASGTADSPAVPSSPAAAADWRTRWREWISALRKRLAALLTPPAEPPKGTS